MTWNSTERCSNALWTGPIQDYNRRYSHRHNDITIDSYLSLQGGNHDDWGLWLCTSAWVCCCTMICSIVLLDYWSHSCIDDWWFTVSKIIRVIRQPRGNMLLIGIGGSGRQSLTRLASYICEYTTFQIEVTRNYRKQEFRDGNMMIYYNINMCQELSTPVLKKDNSDQTWFMFSFPWGNWTDVQENDYCSLNKCRNNVIVNSSMPIY